MFLLSVSGGEEYPLPQGQVRMFAREELGSMRHGKQSCDGCIFCICLAGFNPARQTGANCLCLCLPWICPVLLQARDLFHCFNHPQQSHPSASENFPPRIGAKQPFYWWAYWDFVCVWLWLSSQHGSVALAGEFYLKCIKQRGGLAQLNVY